VKTCSHNYSEKVLLVVFLTTEVAQKLFKMILTERQGKEGLGTVAQCPWLSSREGGGCGHGWSGGYR